MKAGWAALLLLWPLAAEAQSVTATPLPPPPGIPAGPASAPAPARKPVVRTPSALGVPVVPSPGPAAHKVRHPKPAPATKPAVKPAPRPVPKPVLKPAPPAAAPPPVTAAPAPPPPDPTKGTTTGLPLPRWAALRSNEVNLRVGPGMDRAVAWQYHRRDLPVRIEREYEIWRLVEDQDGTKGWVNAAVLTGRRGFVVTGAERVLRAQAADTADAVAKLEVGVVGLIRGCAAGNAWCEVKTGDYDGWLKRTNFYGVDADEAVTP